jgi:intracellular sulfur oxidation DsrE/DsrF family protein
MTAPRRRFLSDLAARVGALSLGVPAVTTALEVPGAGDGTQRRDDAWIAKLRGAERVVFHSHEPTGGLALRWASTFLDTQKTDYGRRDDECSVVVGLNGKSVGLVFADALWERYPIAATLGMSGSVNPNGPRGSDLVRQLLERGVILLACRNSLRAAAQRFLPESERADAAARAEFTRALDGGLLPGTIVVPAMVVTLQHAQDRGCRYVYAGG